MTIVDRFRRLIARATPTGAEREAIARHRESVEACLESALDLIRIRLIGSVRRGTEVRGSSDLDLLVVLSRSSVQRGGAWLTSTTVLNRVRRALEDRFPNTEIGRDGQAVVVSFGDGERSIDVVPGVACGRAADNYRLYKIPDGRDDWMPTSPGLHHRYITDADERSRGKLRNVARLVKLWRKCRTPAVPVRSFHIELLLAYSGICVGAKSYGECLRDFFALVEDRGCASLLDPLGVSGRIRGASTKALAADVVRSVAFAAKHAAKALNAEWWDDGTEAARQWDIVFNGRFPKA